MSGRAVVQGHETFVFLHQCQGEGGTVNEFPVARIIVGEDGVRLAAEPAVVGRGLLADVHCLPPRAADQSAVFGGGLVQTGEYLGEYGELVILSKGLDGTTSMARHG